MYIFCELLKAFYGFAIGCSYLARLSIEYIFRKFNVESFGRFWEQQFENFVLESFHKYKIHFLISLNLISDLKSMVRKTLVIYIWQDGMDGTIV